MKHLIFSIPLILFLLVSCDDGTSDGGTIGDDPVGNLINQENVTELVLQAFEVYSGRAYDNRLNRFPYESAESAQCDNDGVTSQDTTHLSFDNCAIGGDSVSGEVSQIIDSAGINRNFQDFTVTFGDEGRMTVSGGHLIACCTPVDEFSTDNLDYLLSYSGGALQVKGSTTFHRIEAERGVMGGSFSMDPPVASGRIFDVSTTRDFSFDSGANLSVEDIEYNRTHWLFQSGELQILADDGSRVVVNADTGDEQTLSITLGNANGESSATEPWTEFADALRWSPGAHLGSFSRDNSIGIINEVFAYYSGHGYVDTLHSLPGYSDNEYVRFPDLRPTELGGYDFGEPIDVVCSSGGAAAFTPTREEFFSFTGYGWGYSFNNCIDGESTLGGTLSIKAKEIEFTYDAAELSKESVDSSINLSGKVQYNPEGTNSCTSCKFWTGENLQLTVDKSSASVQIFNGNTRFIYNGPSYLITSRLSGSISIKTPATNGQWVHASVLEAFELEYENDAAHEDETLHYYPVGTLQLRSDNGDTLTLEANNGDVRTTTVSLSSPGLSTQFAQYWSVWRDNLLPVLSYAPISGL